jgi:serine protease Do
MINRLLFLFLAFCGLLSASASAQDVPQSREQIQLSFAPLVKQTAPAVVNVLTKRTIAQRAVNPFSRDPFFSQFFGNGPFGGQMREQIENALGSGVIVEETGLIVTNAHVIREADEITVVLADGREFDARLSLKDDASDSAHRPQR